jgi:hypothetical protein
MKYQVTVTYQRRKAVKTHSYVAELKSPICHEIRLTGDEPKLQSVAWTDVISVVITNPPNDQKLRRPEARTPNTQRTHSQNRSANEGLPPALC